MAAMRPAAAFGARVMMTAIGVAFSALGILLVISGVLKLADPKPTSTMLSELSPALHRLPVRLIGICELSLGTAGAAVGGRAIATLVATAYTTFAAVSIVLLRRSDRAVPCGCLGSNSTPVSSVHVLVNLGAAAVATFAALADVPGAFPGGFTAAGALRLALACLAAALIIGAMRIRLGNPATLPAANGLPLRHFGPRDGGDIQASSSDSPAAPDGHPGGSSHRNMADPSSGVRTLPLDIEGTTPAGEAVAVVVAGAGQRTLLAFLAAGCSTCVHLWQELRTSHSAGFAAHETELVLVTRGPPHVDPAAVRAVAPSQHVTVMSSQAWEQYQVPWTPYFILVDGGSSNILAEGTAGSWDDVLALVTGEDGFASRKPVRVAEEFPRSWLDPRVEISRPGIDGRGLTARESFRAGEVVIVLAGLHATGTQAQALTSRNAAAPHPIMLEDDAYLLQAPDDEAAYANHSCNPTLWVDQGYSLAARREISVGDELTIDYATVIADPAWQMACWCGSPCCRGIIRGDDWKLPGLQARYAGHFAPGIAHSISAAD
jgi:hypothetical protein